jgi:hypothetical protein
MKRRHTTRRLSPEERRRALAAFIVPPDEPELPAWWPKPTSITDPQPGATTDRTPAAPSDERSLDPTADRNKNDQRLVDAIADSVINVTMKKREPAKSKPTMTTVLRKAIADSGLPLLTLSEQAGVNRVSLMRFVSGKTSLHLDVADKLADHFDLELRPRGRKAKGK